MALLDGVQYKCIVKVKKPTLSAKQLSMRVGTVKKLTLKNAKLKDVEWTTTDENVAIVVGKGIVVAVGKGTAEIHTTSGGCTDSCLVYFDPADAVLAAMK
jgi:uncharacterized protein YjdB